MPIYEYECPGCKERFEAKREISESDSKLECPSCGEEALRIFSVFSSPVPAGNNGSCSTGFS